MNVTAIIQARMGSTRLPGKILKKVEGKPLLAIQLERLQASKELDQIVIATTNEKQDDVIAQFCEVQGINYYRGSEQDVLKRYYEAAKTFGGEIIVRLTSDCPIIDPQIVDEVIVFYKKNRLIYDYVSNTVERTYPRGLDTEVFSFKAMEKAYFEASLESEREHVTLYLHTNPDVFSIGSWKGKEDYSEHRWTVDTPEDFELIKLILEKLYLHNPLFSLEDTIAVMLQNPTWKKINEHIEQKKV